MTTCCVLGEGEGDKGWGMGRAWPRGESTQAASSGEVLNSTSNTATSSCTATPR